MRHQKAIEWEQRLKSVFDEIDAELEAAYGNLLPLHPVRRPAGATANPETDGLFNVGASFSTGIGSRFGPGYVVEIRLSTLKRIPQKLQRELRNRVQELLLDKLPGAFPGRELFVDKEHHHLRIHGDLSLD